MAEILKIVMEEHHIEVRHGYILDCFIKTRDGLNQIRRKLKIVFKTTDTIMWSEYLIWRK